MINEKNKSLVEEVIDVILDRMIIDDQKLLENEIIIKRLKNEKLGK